MSRVMPGVNQVSRLRVSLQIRSGGEEEAHPGGRESSHLVPFCAELGESCPDMDCNLGPAGLANRLWYLRCD